MANFGKHERRAEIVGTGLGTIGWVDITVEDAAPLRDFYAAVVGLETHETDMGGYSDFTLMVPGTETPVAGVCHARGQNEGLPPVWLVYFTVADINAAVAAAKERGATVIKGPSAVSEGGGGYAVLRDPQGAPFALYQGGEG